MENSENTCLVCHEAIEIFAIGSCDHPICFKCSTRMRALCEQLYCPICRTDLPEVFTNFIDTSQLSVSSRNYNRPTVQHVTTTTCHFDIF